MGKLYRVKHVPSGLFYKPMGNGGSHLGNRGKIYTTAANGVAECKEKVHICLRKGSKSYKKIAEELKYKPDHGDSLKAWFIIPKDEFTEEIIDGDTEI